MADSERIPILLFPVKHARRARFLTPLARFLLTPGERRDIESSHLSGEPEHYMIAFVMSSLMWAILLSGAIFALQLLLELKDPSQAAPMSVAAFAISFFGFFYIHYIYPSILSKKVGETTDRMLLHVLREMWIESTSGVPLYSMLVNVSRGDYGNISDDLREAVRDITAGERDILALEKIAKKTRSEGFKRVLWHITSSMRTGIGLTAALDSALKVMTAEQTRAVKEYGSSLNFYLLLYLLFAAVIPAITITFVSLLSSFGVFAISFDLLVGLVVGSAVFQFILIGFMRVGRPEI